MAEVIKGRRRLRSAAYLNRRGVVIEDHELDGSLTGDNLINVLLAEEDFITQFDKEVSTLYAGPSLAYQNSRKLGALDRKLEGSHSQCIAIGLYFVRY